MRSSAEERLHARGPALVGALARHPGRPAISSHLAPWRRRLARSHKLLEREQAIMAESIEPRLEALRREAAIVLLSSPAARPGSRHDERGRFAAGPQPPK